MKKEEMPEDMRRLAEANACVRFVLDNYGMLCAAHRGKVVMVMERQLWAGSPEAYVAKTFATMVDAMMYTHAMDMSHVPYVLKECGGGDAMMNLTYSIGCKEGA